MTRVWLITGCSSGLGRELAEAAIANGDCVVATARNPVALAELAQLGAHVAALDVTWDDGKLRALVNQVVADHGAIDVLVNNAAYILEGAVEECSDGEVQRVFDTNVFGMLRMVRAVLPHMRERRSGVIANVGSAGGWTGIPVIGVYGATKFAIAGATLALREEVAHLGVDVTVVELGAFRTSILGKGFVPAQQTIDDYAKMTEPVKAHVAKYSGQQPGDPKRGARLLVEALTKTGRCAGKALPGRLLLGSDAVALVDGVLGKSKLEVEDWRELSASTDFPKPVEGSCSATETVKSIGTTAASMMEATSSCP